MTQEHIASPSSVTGWNSSRAVSSRLSVVVGGSAGVGRALVYQLVARGDTVLAVARGRRDLEAVRDDCALRLAGNVRCLAADVAARDFDARAFVGRCARELGRVTHVFLPIGEVDQKDTGLPPVEIIESLTTVNYVRPAQLLSAFCDYFSSAGEGKITAFTTIAAAVPRGNNAAYAAAKKSLEFYCRALQHHFYGSRVSVQICAPGYVDTGMSFGLKLRFPAARPEEVARFAIDMTEKRTRFGYCPPFWFWITILIKLVPWAIFRCLRF